MTTVLAHYPSDSPGYTHFILLEPTSGIIVGEVDDLEYDYNGPIADPNTGERLFNKGDKVTQVSVGIDRAREFNLAGNLTKVTFPDGTIWTPET